jgi:hypothetical protein
MLTGLVGKALAMRSHGAFGAVFNASAHRQVTHDSLSFLYAFLNETHQ